MVSKCATSEEYNNYICPEGSSSVSSYLHGLQDDRVGTFISTFSVVAGSAAATPHISYACHLHMNASDRFGPCQAVTRWERV